MSEYLLNFIFLFIGVKEILNSIKLFKTNKTQSILSLIIGIFVCLCCFLLSIF